MLADTMEGFVESGESVSVKTVFEIFGDFLLLSLLSVLIGLFFGITAGLVTKYCRFLSHSAI